MKCIACDRAARADLAFCEACDAEFAENYVALQAFEERTGFRHWMLLVRIAPRGGCGGVTAYPVGGTSRLDQANALGTKRGAWADEANAGRETDRYATSRMQLVLVDRDGVRYVIRDKRFDDRIAAAHSPTSELERAARLDDPKDPIWLSIVPRTW